MPDSMTIEALLAPHPADAPAIGAPDRPWLSYGDLRDQIDRTRRDLGRAGFGRPSRVAIVLPNGPEMAAAFVAIAGGATTAPLNPAYRDEEFDFYLRRPAGEGAGRRRPATTAPARRGRRRHGVPVLRLARRRGRAGRQLRLTLDGAPAGVALAAGAEPAGATSRWSCTPRAPPRGRRSCR